MIGTSGQDEGVLTRPAAAPELLPHLRRNAFVVAAAWTTVVVLGAEWQFRQDDVYALGLARVQADRALDGELQHRRWTASHGDVYVLTTEEDPPDSSSSDVENRRLMTTSGLELARVDVGYMNGPASEVGGDPARPRVHVTSLATIWPGHAPDAWEAEALRALERGQTEVVGLDRIGEAEYLRLMRPLITEEECRDCPMVPGYNEGDVRGGISISVAMVPMRAIRHGHLAVVAMSYGTVWVLGLVGIGLGAWVLGGRVRDRERGQAKLYRVSERLSTSIDQMPIGYILWDSSFRVLDWNPSAERIFGYSKSEMLGRSSLDYITPESARPRVHEVIETLLAGDRATYSGVGNNICKDGTRKSCHWYGAALRNRAGTPFAALSMVVDVTEKRQAEKQLRQYETMVSSSSDMVALVDRRYVCLNANAASLRLLDKTSDEVIGRSLAQLFGEEFFDTVIRPRAERCMAGHEFCYQHWFEFPIAGRRYMDVAYFPHSGPDGKVLGFVVTARDITAKKRADERLERLSLAIEQVAEAVCITDAAGSIQYVNSAFERITGYPREETIGQNPRILKSGEQDDAFYKEMWDTLLRGDVWDARLVNRKKDGTLYTETSVISPVRDASGRTINYVAVSRDITEELDLEAQFRQAQKMESIGQLAGGVAHDFNNMLAVILGNIELAMEQPAVTESLRANLAEIQEAAERSAALTRQLLAFARKQTIAPRVLDLNEAVEGMLNMLRRLIGPDIDLDWTPGAALWAVEVDPSQIDQVMANLCVNARDAIAGGGKVTIGTANQDCDQAYCADHPGSAVGQYVILAVADDGSGMSKDVLDRIYEPFFTTKEAGVGTGLGLSTVYGIMEQNGGFIDVYSEPGRGATFKLYLPRHEATVAQTQGQAKPIERGHDSILVVEDEAAILTLVTNLLLRQGYTVLAASTPAEAIRLAEACPSGGIQLLVTDVVMPEMSGWELAERLSRCCPRLKYLFMSGYTAGTIRDKSVLDEQVPFIQKPFTMNALAAKVRTVLDRE